MVAFAAHIKSGEPFPEEWYSLPDGVFFLGEKRGFGNKLKIRQAKFITLVCSALKRLVSHRPIIMLACRQAYMDLYEFLESKDVGRRTSLPASGSVWQPWCGEEHVSGVLPAQVCLP